MKILILGDIIAYSGVDYVASFLWNYRKNNKIDFVIANGENSADGNGIDKYSSEKLLFSGVDVLTSGNHAFKRKESCSIYEDNENILRPANFSNELPGKGYGIYKIDNLKVLIINLMGNAFLNQSLNNSFLTIDNILEKNKGEYDISILDFHAESTGEKKAMGYYLDGKVNVVYGTHTHVQTADEKILKNGTGYITDIGMCGSEDSVLGVVPERIIENMKYGIPTKYDILNKNIKASGIEIEFEDKKLVSIKRVNI